MNILVTGATGFIGSHLVEKLSESTNNNVTCLVRPFSNPNAILKLPVNFRIDLGYLDHYAVIYHIAGILGNSKILYQDYYYVHVEMTKMIINHMNSNQQLVYMSSAYVEKPKANSSYEITKILGEREVINSHHNFTIVRPSFIYGPGDYHLLPLYQYIKHLGPFFPVPGWGTNKICPTYVHDLIKNILPDNLKPNSIMTIAGEPITMNGFLKTIANELGSPRPLIHIPPIIKRDFFTTERTFTNTNSLGTTSLKQGMKETIQWCKSHSLL